VQFSECAQLRPKTSISQATHSAFFIYVKRSGRFPRRAGQLARPSRVDCHHFLRRIKTIFGVLLTFTNADKRTPMPKFFGCRLVREVKSGCRRLHYRRWSPLFVGVCFGGRCVVGLLSAPVYRRYVPNNACGHSPAGAVRLDLITHRSSSIIATINHADDSR
jgi:hypothetical protein